MRFAYPYFWVLIIFPLALSLFFFWALRERRRALEKFAQTHLLKELLSGVRRRAHVWKAVLLAAGLLLCLAALMRPQWGFRWQEVKRRGIDILIAVDTSRSMLSSDIKPSRLERAKLAAGDFASRLKGDRIGLIAFAGSAFLECPLTVDYGGFLLSLESLEAGLIPRGGTSISSAIKEAMSAFVTASGNSKVLILVTDGEDHEGDAVRLAGEAAKQGIIIHCIGVGSREGELIFVGGDNGREFLKDSQGNAVKSRLDEETLGRIAMAAGGTYVRSSGVEFGLDLLYKEKLSAMEKSESEGRMSKAYEERYQIFLFLALLLISVETAVRSAAPGKAET